MQMLLVYRGNRVLVAANYNGNALDFRLLKKNHKLSIVNLKSEFSTIVNYSQGPPLSLLLAQGAHQRLLPKIKKELQSITVTITKTYLKFVTYIACKTNQYQLSN